MPPKAGLLHSSRAGNTSAGPVGPRSPQWRSGRKSSESEISQRHLHRSSQSPCLPLSVTDEPPCRRGSRLRLRRVGWPCLPIFSTHLHNRSFHAHTRSLTCGDSYLSRLSHHPIPDPPNHLLPLPSAVGLPVRRDYIQLHRRADESTITLSCWGIWPGCARRPSEPPHSAATSCRAEQHGCRLHISVRKRSSHPEHVDH